MNENVYLIIISLESYIFFLGSYFFFRCYGIFLEWVEDCCYGYVNRDFELCNRSIIYIFFYGTDIQCS